MTIQQIFDILVGICLVVSSAMLIVSVAIFVAAVFFQPPEVAPDDEEC